jgi:hypothetical protein
MDNTQLENISLEFNNKSDEELLQIAYLSSGEYLEEVIELAKKELSKRDIDENTEKGKTMISLFIQNSIPTSEQTIPTEEDTEPQMEIDETKYNELLKSIELKQNLSMGILGGIVASMVGAIIWAIVTIITGYQIGFMAIGVGFLVGYSVRILGKGINNTFGMAGAILSFIGCVLGNILSICISASQYESIPLLQIISNLNVGIIVELMIETFHPMDLLFYGIAVYEGYKFSFRELSEDEIASIIIQDDLNVAD